ncbi:putative toxin-antitoxin system toxin component, PIN family [Patescibacteria group bacterium]|nr:putative toxin-antitoxin system toxin component, PIN family [Patescibacteria group bacterium]
MAEQADLLKVVIDTNIFISGLISTTGSPAALLDKWEEGKFTLLISQVIIDEFVEVVNRQSC